MWDIGVHLIDAALFTLNFPKPNLAYGRAYSVFPDKMNMRSDYPVSPNSRFAYPSKTDVDDFALGLMDFENGMTSYIQQLWDS